MRTPQYVIWLPRLIGLGWADTVIDQAGIPSTAAGHEVIIDGRAVRTAAEGFGERLVEVLMSERKADGLIMVECPSVFVKAVKAEATRRRNAGEDIGHVLEKSRRDAGL
jgi:hypothetical protein